MSIRMSNEMRELRNQLKTALDNIDKAVSNGDVEAAENAKAEADKVRNLLTIAENAFEARKGLETDDNDDNNGGGEGVKYNAQLFYKAVSGQTLTEAEAKAVKTSVNEYKNKYSEGSKADGGYTVPKVVE